MNFFEQEFRKITDPLALDCVFVERLCYVHLAPGILAKLGFATLRDARPATSITATILNRRSGVIDSVRIEFEQLFPPRETGVRFPQTYVPRIEYSGHGYLWYIRDLTDEDYAVIREQLRSYLALFSGETEDMKNEQQFS